MLRLSYRLYRLATWMRFVLPRRFTPAGLLALVALAATALFTLDLDQTVASQGFALVLCVLLISMTASLFFGGRFAAQRWLPRYGTVGQPLAYHVTVQNRNGRRLEHLEV